MNLLGQITYTSSEILEELNKHAIRLNMCSRTHLNDIVGRARYRKDNRNVYIKCTDGLLCIPYVDITKKDSIEIMTMLCLDDAGLAHEEPEYIKDRIQALRDFANELEEGLK